MKGFQSERSKSCRAIQTVAQLNVMPHLTETLSGVMSGKKVPNEAVHSKNTSRSQKYENVSVFNLNINSEENWLGDQDSNLG
jgi:hypothetical protein